MTLFTQLLSTVCLVLACAEKNELVLGEPQSKILSAYHGLDALGAGANAYPRARWWGGTSPGDIFIVLQEGCIVDRLRVATREHYGCYARPQN